MKNNSVAFYSGVQYIKDLSFENPNAPQIFLKSAAEKPEIVVTVDLASSNIEGSHYEVVLSLVAKAKVKEETLFVLELSYAGVFTIENANESILEEILLVTAPTILFPFARRIVSDVTRDGGLAPLMLDPVDFVTAYQTRKKK